MTAWLSPEKRNGIISAYEAGDPISEISRRFGVSKSYPGQLVKARGLPLRTPMDRRKLMARAASWKWRQRNSNSPDTGTSQ